MVKHLIRILSLFLCASSLLYAAESGKTSMDVGAEYTTGNYGTTSDTDIWYFPVTFNYRAEVTAFSVTVPYVMVKGTGAVVPAFGGMHVVRPTATVTRRTESGLGDVIVSGSYRLVPETDRSARVDLTGLVKLGTADENDNLGTGENDYAAQVDLERGFGRNRLFGTIGYKVLGDPPGINLRDVLYGSFGGSHRLNKTLRAELSLFGQEATTAGSSKRLELTAALNNETRKGVGLTGYALIGLADGSPDWGIGIIVRLSR